MRVTHLGHATVLVESAGTRILIDPGNFSDLWHSTTGLDAVLVTHQHPDHLDDKNTATLLAANPRAKLFVEPAIPGLIDGGQFAYLGSVEPLASGEAITIGGVTVSAVGGTHAEIHRDIPLIGNIGLVLRAEGEPTFFHPGDSYATTPDGIDVLAVPAYGPWGALKETIDFVRAIGPAHAIPIHDELLADRGKALIFGRIEAMAGAQVSDLRGGSSNEF